jgi:hypothetical protein
MKRCGTLFYVGFGEERRCGKRAVAILTPGNHTATQCAQIALRTATHPA